jgi:hypothetical protein
LGFVKEHVIDHVPSCHDEEECECPEKCESRHCLVLHIVGDLPFWDFVNEFSEYLNFSISPMSPNAPLMTK